MPDAKGAHPQATGAKPSPSVTHHSPEAKRDEFRKYLEKTGVLDALTRVLVGLYEEPEKPVNPTEYFLERLATGVPMKEQLQNLHSELEELQERLKEVEEENVSLRSRLEKYNVKYPEMEESGEGAEAPPEAEP